MKITVSAHALQRAQERLGCTVAEARALLRSPAVRCAADFGARVVRCTRARIVLTYTSAGVTVLTVLPIDGNHIPAQLRPGRLGGPMPTAHDPHFHRSPKP